MSLEESVRKQRLQFPQEVAPYEESTVIFLGAVIFNHRTPLISILLNMSRQMYVEQNYYPHYVYQMCLNR